MDDKPIPPKGDGSRAALAIGASLTFANKDNGEIQMVDVYIWICDFGLLEIRLRFQDLSGPSPLVKIY